MDQARRDPGRPLIEIRVMREIKKDIELLGEVVHRLDKQTPTWAGLALLLFDNSLKSGTNCLFGGVKVNWTHFS